MAEGNKKNFSTRIIAGTEGFAKINFLTRIGGYKEQAGYTISALNDTVSANEYSVKTTIPTVMKVRWMPTIGDYREGESPLSVAMIAYFTKVRANNSSLAAYQPIDILKLIFALANLNIMMADMRRAIEVACEKNSMINAGLTGALRTAVGAPDGTTIASQISAYNKICVDAAALMLPKDVEIVHRWYELSKKIWKEEPELKKTQYIVFVPELVFYMDTDAESEDIGQFKSEAWADKTLDQKLEFTAQLVDRYCVDEDFNNMCAELLKAYKYDALHFNGIPAEVEQNHAEFKFDDNVIDALKNSRPASQYFTNVLTTMEVREVNDGGVGSHLQHFTKDAKGRHTGINLVGANSIFVWKKGAPQPLFAHQDEPSEQTVADITPWRYDLESAGYSLGTGMPIIKVTNFATEVILMLEFIEFLQSGARLSFKVDGITSYNSDFDNLGAAFTFAAMPAVCWYKVGSVHGMFYGDVDNITYIVNNELKALHDSAVTAGFAPLGTVEK